eukprot:scaffold830_cov112-Isochrysis_galbana.AAC.6
MQYARHLVERAERVCTQGTCDTALADEYLEGLWVRLSEHLSGCVSFTAASKASPRGARSRAARLRTAAEGEGSASRAAAAAAAASAGARARAVPREGRARTPTRATSDDSEEEDHRRKKRRGDAGRGSPKEKKKAPKKKKASKSKKTPRSGGKRTARAGEKAKSFAPSGRRLACALLTCVRAELQGATLLVQLRASEPQLESVRETPLLGGRGHELRLAPSSRRLQPRVLGWVVGKEKSRLRPPPC